MTDVPSGAREPGSTPGVDVPTTVDPGYAQAPGYADPAYPDSAYLPPAQSYGTPAATYSEGAAYGESATYEDGPDSATDKAKQVAGQTKQAATHAASDVKDTALDQAQRVAGEAKAQARNLASDVRDRVGDQARTQNDKLVSSIRQTADHLEEMRGDRPDSPAAAVVSRVADGGRQLADYLDRNGPEGVLREVQDFARRRPGAFLATALAAGFVVGRLGKGVAKADPDPGHDKPSTDSFSSTGTGAGYTTGYVDPAVDPGYAASSGYAAGTGYPAASTEYAATGTGTPVVVEEVFVADDNYPENRR